MLCDAHALHHPPCFAKMARRLAEKKDCSKAKKSRTKLDIPDSWKQEASAHCSTSVELQQHLSHHMCCSTSAVLLVSALHQHFSSTFAIICVAMCLLFCSFQHFSRTSAAPFVIICDAVVWSARCCFGFSGIRVFIPLPKLRQDLSQEVFPSMCSLILAGFLVVLLQCTLIIMCLHLVVSHTSEEVVSVAWERWLAFPPQTWSFEDWRIPGQSLLACTCLRRLDCLVGEDT